MKVLINTSHLRFGGALQVALSFIQECRYFPQHQYHVLVGPGVAKSLRTDDFTTNFQFEYFDFGIINLRKAILINKTLQSVERRIRPDCIITTSGPSYFRSQAPQVMGYNLGLYIYPESPFIQSLSFWWKIRINIKRKFHFYFFKRDADAFIVQTDDVNTRVRKALSTKNVVTVTNTYGSFYKNWDIMPNKLPQKAPNIFRFVTISAYYKHKNLDIIPKVIKELERRNVKNVEFVLTLKPSDFDKYIHKHDRIHNLGPIRPEECPALYAECDGMFLPTLAECFSASYPEAMIMEKPIITTDLGFARSICGAAALYYEANDPVAAAEKIAALIKDACLQNKLKEIGKIQLQSFDTPRQRARKYLEICAGLAKSSADFS